MQAIIGKLHWVCLGFKNTSQQHLVRGPCNDDTSHVFYDGISGSNAQMKHL